MDTKTFRSDLEAMTYSMNSTVSLRHSAILSAGVLRLAGIVAYAKHISRQSGR